MLQVPDFSCLAREASTSAATARSHELAGPWELDNSGIVTFGSALSFMYRWWTHLKSCNQSKELAKHFRSWEFLRSCCCQEEAATTGKGVSERRGMAEESPKCQGVRCDVDMRNHSCGMRVRFPVRVKATESLLHAASGAQSMGTSAGGTVVLEVETLDTPARRTSSILLCSIYAVGLWRETSE